MVTVTDAPRGGEHDTVSALRDILTWKQNAGQHFLIEAAKNLLVRNL